MNKNILKDKKGIFGLTAVQEFFIIILGLALLAYVIVIIMGTLNTASIIPQSSASAANESVSITQAGATLIDGGYPNMACKPVTSILNATGNVAIGLGNISQTGCLVTNATQSCAAGTCVKPWLISYPYTYDGSALTNSKQVLGNVSTGISGFFSSINPIYVILAVLVIILVLIVLVRVVSAPSGSTRSTQL